jgi:tetratricopeptide (TPR) repeat protein
MQRFLFITTISLIFSLLSYAQDLDQVKRFADAQFQTGNYTSALKEYQRVMFFDQQHRHSDLFRNIAAIFYAQNDFDEASKYYDLASKAEANDSIKFELILLKGLCHLKQGNYLETLSELFDLPDMESDILNKRKNFYLGTTYFGIEGYNQALDYFQLITDSAGMVHLNSLFSDFESFRKKYNPRKIERMSKIIPGLGQLAAGETFSGLNSLALLSAIMYYAVRTAISYGYIDGMLVLSGWFYRYYTGGYGNASEMAKNRIAHKKGEVYTGIIEVVEQYEKKQTQP